MNRFRKTLAALLIGVAISGFGAVAIQQSAGAEIPFLEKACEGENADTALCKEQTTIEVYVKNIVNALLYVLGAVSVVVIVIAGIYYTTSGGDANLIKRAKDTLLYAVIGLIVAIMAYAIVNFVIGVFI